MVTEKEGAMCLRFMDGRMDYACFVDKNPVASTGLETYFFITGIKESGSEATIFLPRCQKLRCSI